MSIFALQDVHDEILGRYLRPFVLIISKSQHRIFAPENAYHLVNIVQNSL